MNFSIFLSEAFVWTYCGAIALLWLILTAVLIWKSLALHAKLRALSNELQSIEGEAGFSTHFEAYNSKVEKEFHLHWTEFVETLVLPELGSNLPIRNTVDVSRYLNDSTIIFPVISFSFYRSVPNLLTGLGILGTFLGLAFGVGAASSGISSGNPSQITASLQQLLDGASLAFWTSIFGVFLSLLFVPVLHFCRRALHLQMNRWIGTLERRMRRVTPESVALEQLEQAERTTKELRTFNTELVFSIQKALDEGIAGRLTPRIERLIDAVDGIRSDRSTDAGQMVERALDRFTVAMQEKTGDQFETMSSIVGSLNKTLKDSTVGFSKSQKDMGETLSSAMAEVKKSMGAGTAAMTATLEQSLADVTRTISRTSQDLADHFTESSSKAATELNEMVSSSAQRITDSSTEAVIQISGSLRGLIAISEGLQQSTESLERSTEKSEKVLSNMTTFVDKLTLLRKTVESAHQQIESAGLKIGDAAAKIHASSQQTTKVTDRMQRIFDNLESMISELNQHQQWIASTWARYQDRFEGIDQSLERVFRQLDEGLSRYCEQVKAFANELDKTTAHTVESLAAATGELSESIEDLTDHLQTAR